MDKALDDIIATRPRARRAGSRRGSGRAAILGNPVASPTQRTKAAATKATATSTSPAPADKIIVSNLPQDVNEAQIKELFHATVGPLRDVTLHYDASGRSKGVAAIHFQRKGDGTKAYQQYNNRLIDGKRPMRIEIVVDPARPAPPPSLVARVAPAATTVATENAPATRARGVRRARRGGGPRKTERPPKSAADLDAEMEDYTASNAPAAA